MILVFKTRFLALQLAAEMLDLIRVLQTGGKKSTIKFTASLNIKKKEKGLCVAFSVFDNPLLPDVVILFPKLDYLVVHGLTSNIFPNFL